MTAAPRVWVTASPLQSAAAVLRVPADSLRARLAPKATP